MHTAQNAPHNHITLCDISHHTSTSGKRTGCRPGPTQGGLGESTTHPKVTADQPSKPWNFCLNLFTHLKVIHYFQCHGQTDRHTKSMQNESPLYPIRVRKKFFSTSHKGATSPVGPTLVRASPVWTNISQQYKESRYYSVWLVRKCDICRICFDIFRHVWPTA